jgi:hypothetical protein
MGIFGPEIEKCDVRKLVYLTQYDEADEQPTGENRFVERQGVIPVKTLYELWPVERAREANKGVLRVDDAVQCDVRYTARFRGALNDHC